ncbi:hypothetical protein QN239_31405 [Mycolicibacterium sp. Y3]
MGTLNIAAAREIIVAYGQSSSAWAATTINTWLGVIVGTVVLIVATSILRDQKKEEAEKVKSIALVSIGAVILTGVVMMFINNKFGGASTRVSDTLN